MHHADHRKIDPARRKPDGSPDDNNRIEIGPTQLAFDEWAAAGLQAPNLDRLRAYRLQRIVDTLAAQNVDAVLLFDPLNIRYATDSTSMQLWNTHNPFRACLVCANGYMVLWDYKNSPFLAEFNPLVREVRSGASMFYFATGDRSEEAAAAFAGQIVELAQTHIGAGRRLAVDKIMMHGLRALEGAGFEVHDGERVMEHARVIKGPDEILAMRCAVYACEQAVREMERQAAPGMTEDDIWAVLHAENIKRGGEWIETRLLASGPRTNPWFQECGPRVVQNNEILAFDTDLIGVYGLCCDISRTWFLGDGEPTQAMKDDYRLALDHIQENQQLVKPGTTFRELVFEGHQLPELYERQKYSCRFHGVGLCDEWPMITYPSDYLEGAFEGELQPGMMLCVEALVSREGGDFSIKLEDQLLVTEDGVENLTRYPFDEKFLS
ncbi:MAG: aminopeptidase P family protein [Gammaproteobacteria bacterium]|nr:aminopeptidase P family protein [Gammaproteobacteria bacterium]